MAFKPTTWYRIAVALTVLNLVGGGFAVGAAEPEHAAIHAVFAVGFWLWARRLRRRFGESESESEIEIASDSETRLEALSDEVNNLRRELNETQERLDFVERMLARGPEARRVDPQR